MGVLQPSPAEKKKKKKKKKQDVLAAH